MGNISTHLIKHRSFLNRLNLELGLNAWLVNEAIGSEDRLLKPGQAVTPRFSDNHDNIVCPHCVEELCVIRTLGVGYFAGYSPAVPYLEGWWDEWCMEWFNLIKYLDVDGLVFCQGDPKIVATRIRKAQAAAKRKAEKNRGSEGASGPEKGSKRRKEKATDHIPCPTPLQTIEGHPYDTRVDELEMVIIDDDVDEEVNLEGPERHVNDTTERVVLEAESIPPTATRPDNGKSIAQEETISILIPFFRGVGADGAGSSLPPPLFVPTWGIHQRSRVTTPEECRDLMANLTPPGVQERKMHLLGQ
ncbi:hypothetical protein Tco_1503260 [Tanacetum coccineum]